MPEAELAPEGQGPPPSSSPARATFTGLRVGLIGLVLVAVFAAKELVFWKPPLTFKVGAAAEEGVLHDWESAPDDAELPLRFSDGTLITLEPRARARVVAIGRAGAQAVIDWMLSEEVQAALPESMYVFPVREGVELPEDWARFAPRPEEPLAVDPADIEANRDTWLREWQELVSR